MDAFFASVEQLDNPSYVGKPVIVGADPKGGKGRGVVSTCSYEARKFGIHSAMPISTAYKKCPNGIFVTPNMYRYAEESEKIFTIFEHFTPDVEPISIDEAFLDITGSYKHFGTPLETCRKIKATIKKETGLTASLGMAPNMMTAKIASDIQKPDGLVIIEPGMLKDFLRPLPVKKIWGIGQKTREALAALGITTVGELADYNKLSFIEHFGRHGEHIWELANGIDPRRIEHDHETRSISNEHTFDTDTGDINTIEGTIMFLSGKVSRRMRSQRFKCRTVTLKIRFSDFTTFTRSLTLDEPTNFVHDLYESCISHLPGFKSKNKNVRLVGVKASNLVETQWDLDLFRGNNIRRQKNEKLHKALDKIKDKFGERSIGFRAT